MSITPFHFACHCEERLRTQFEILDPALGGFVHIFRRFSLTESRALLQFGKKPITGEEFTTHVNFHIQQVPQKEKQTAFNCTLECPTEKLYKNFRLLLSEPDEAETQILKVLEFLQKAFFSLGYTTAKPASKKAEAEQMINTGANEKAASTSNVTAEISEHAVLETAKALVQTVAPAIEKPTPEISAITGGKKYILEKTPGKGESVQLRNYDGKYVPEGELPAVLRMKS